MENQVREREELLVIVPVLGLRRSEEEREREREKGEKEGGVVTVLYSYSLRRNGERITQGGREGNDQLGLARTHAHTHTHIHAHTHARTHTHTYTELTRSTSKSRIPTPSSTRSNLPRRPGTAMGTPSSTPHSARRRVIPARAQSVDPEKMAKQRLNDRLLQRPSSSR